VYIFAQTACGEGGDHMFSGILKFKLFSFHPFFKSNICRKKIVRKVFESGVITPPHQVLLEELKGKPTDI
jgi:hypothetical protein